ncbi:MAG TPA: globin domain-containing protein [Methyloceanibacter sp.]|nr:globin domain-containing protein [Methyloceanibacter sp.]
MPVALNLSSSKTMTRMRLKRVATPAEAPLTDEHKRRIRESYAKIEPAIDLVAQVFFRKLFALDSSLRAKFSGPIEIQTRKFTAAMKLTMITLSQDEELTPTLKLLGARHRQLGIRTRHYRMMAKALIWTLEQSLEKGFTRETRAAWSALLDRITRSLT